MIDLESSFTAASDLLARAQANSIRLQSALVESNQQQHDVFRSKSIRPENIQPEGKISNIKYFRKPLQYLNSQSVRSDNAVDADSMEDEENTKPKAKSVLADASQAVKEESDHNKNTLSFQIIDDISPPDFFEASEDVRIQVNGTQMTEIQHSAPIHLENKDTYAGKTSNEDRQDRPLLTQMKQEISSLNQVHKQIIDMNQELLEQQQKLIDRTYGAVQKQVLNQIYLTQKLQDVQLGWHKRQRRQLELASAEVDLLKSSQHRAKKEIIINSDSDSRKNDYAGITTKENAHELQERPTIHAEVVSDSRINSESATNASRDLEKLDIDSSPLDVLLRTSKKIHIHSEQHASVLESLPPFDYNLMKTSFADRSDFDDGTFKWPTLSDFKLYHAIKLSETVSQRQETSSSQNLRKNVTKSTGSKKSGSQEYPEPVVPFKSGKIPSPTKKSKISPAAEKQTPRKQMAPSTTIPKQIPEFEPTSSSKRSNEAVKARSRTPNFYNVRLSNAPVFLRRTNIKPPTLQYLDNTISKIASPKRNGMVSPALKPSSTRPITPSINQISAPLAKDTAASRPSYTSQGTSPIVFTKEIVSKAVSASVTENAEIVQNGIGMQPMPVLKQDVSLQTLPMTSSFGIQANLIEELYTEPFSTTYTQGPLHSKKPSTVTQTDYLPETNIPDRTHFIDEDNQSISASYSSEVEVPVVHFIKNNKRSTASTQNTRRRINREEFPQISQKPVNRRDDFDSRVAQWIQNEVLLRVASQSLTKDPTKPQRHLDDLAIQTEEEQENVSDHPQFINQTVQTEEVAHEDTPEKVDAAISTSSLDLIFYSDEYCEIWMTEYLMTETLKVVTKAIQEVEIAERDAKKTCADMQTDPIAMQDETFQTDIFELDQILKPDLQNNASQTVSSLSKINTAVQSDRNYFQATHDAATNTDYFNQPLQDGVPEEKNISRAIEHRTQIIQAARDTESASKSEALSDGPSAIIPVSEAMLSLSLSESHPVEIPSLSIQPNVVESLDHTYETNSLVKESSSSTLSLSTQLSEGEVLTQFYSEGQIVERIQPGTFQRLVGKLPPVPETLLQRTSKIEEISDTSASLFSQEQKGHDATAANRVISDSSGSNPTTSSGHVTSLGEVTEIEFSQSHPSYDDETAQIITVSGLNLTESSESDLL